MDDLLAIRRLKRGEIEALEVLVIRYEKKAIRVAYLITHDESLARDIHSAPLMLESLAGLATLELRLSPELVVGWLTLILSHPAATQSTKQQAEKLLEKTKQHVTTNAPSLEDAVKEILDE